MNRDDAAEAVREAERTVYQAQWRVWEEAALDHLVGRSGLAWTPLVPGSDVIQLVTYNGEHLGHVRRDSVPGPGERWVAARKGQAHQIGSHASAAEAAASLLRANGGQTGTAR